MKEPVSALDIIGMFIFIVMLFFSGVAVIIGAMAALLIISSILASFYNTDTMITFYILTVFSIACLIIYCRYGGGTYEAQE